MSSRYYSQNICQKGHLYKGESDKSRCPHCGEITTWTNEVDDCNVDDYGFIPDDSLSNFKISEDVYQMCNLGHSHLIEPARYRIPSQEETWAMRTFIYDREKMIRKEILGELRMVRNLLNLLNG